MRDEAVVLTGDDNLSDQVVQRKLVLDLLRGDILTIREYDEIFETTVDIQKSLLVEIALVSGMEPSLLQRSSGLLRHLVVLLHDRATLNQDLSGLLVDFDHDIFQRFSDRTRLVALSHIGTDTR